VSRGGVPWPAIQVEGSAERRDDVGTTGAEEAGGGEQSSCGRRRLLDRHGRVDVTARVLFLPLCPAVLKPDLYLPATNKHANSQ